MSGNRVPNEETEMRISVAMAPVYGSAYNWNSNSGLDLHQSFLNVAEMLAFSSPSKRCEPTISEQLRYSFQVI
ncbi:hypothetical protein EGR_06529 [Echinococcus granulosus]|uniref:Uncharacterized protein n=1 Tax=Echinococcus granulosus TaxID=6210 RepID=W6UCZ7_ECHGR|nr:hypothetical protein EGR_06529 [Echinococcus granulosus]EUB58646.1 hypothetical protein EGR_06529 [Echinococcus granulosus]